MGGVRFPGSKINNRFIMETYTVGSVAAVSVPVMGAVISYFLKKTFDKVEHIDTKLDRIGQDVSGMRPKVDILWRDKVGKK